MLAVATVLVGGRIMSKTMVLRRFRMDDVFLLITWVRLRRLISSFEDRNWLMNIFRQLQLFIQHVFSYHITMALGDILVSIFLHRIQWRKLTMAVSQ